MTGLELSKKYFAECGEPMMERDFPEITPKCAFALCGEGSECLGFDDDVSRDHDFEPGFCVFVPDDTNEKTMFRLERAYAKLPQDFEGFTRQRVLPVGGRRHGIIKTGDFYEKFVGERRGELSLLRFATIEPHFLLAATNGEIFRDDSGEFSAIREKLNDMPVDAWLKRIAGHLLMAKQAGQYNFTRCVDRGEYGAAQLCAIEYAKHVTELVFLINRAYSPFYKWKFRAMRELEKLSDLADVLEFLISTESDRKTVENKYCIIEDVAGMIITELQALEITDAICGDLEKHAYSVNDKISNNELRQMNVLASV